MDTKDWSAWDWLWLWITGFLVVTAILAIVPGFETIGGWLKEKDAPAWAQAIISTAAIAIGASAVWWQVRQQRMHVVAAESGALKIIAQAVFFARAKVEMLQATAASGVNFKKEVDDLSKHLVVLKSFPLLAMPDYRGAFAVGECVGALDALEEALKPYNKTGLQLSGIDALSKDCNRTKLLIEDLERMVRDSLKERGSDVPAMTIDVDDLKIYSLSAPHP